MIKVLIADDHAIVRTGLRAKVYYKLPVPSQRQEEDGAVILPIAPLVGGTVQIIRQA